MAYLSGANNDAMVNRLVAQGFIISAEVEQAFRVVDRGEFIPDDRKAQAYNDAMVINDRHFKTSASHFYALILEALKPTADMKFLNVCCGTGYLTMLVSYLIGPGGLLHSIEPGESACKFAEEKASNFLSRSPFKNRFCHSSFAKTSIFHITNRYKYDRIYVGGMCPGDKLNYMLSFLKIGGIMVMPVQDELQRITRLTGRRFSRQTMAMVTFSPIPVPAPQDPKSGKCTLSDKVRQDGTKVPLKLPENKDPVAKRLLSRFRALISALECLPVGVDLPKSLCFIPRTVGSILVKDELREIGEIYHKKCGDVPSTREGEAAVDTEAVVKDLNHRRSTEIMFFWEDLRDDTIWQEMVEYCFAANVEDDERREACFHRMCKAALVKKLSPNDHHHVYHDVLSRQRHRDMPYPMMMESYQQLIMELFEDSDSDSDDDGEKKIRAERRARMRMMGPSRRMMPEMLMMEMMHGYDLEDADFFFDELPFMMRMGPMRRFGYGGRERKREFDEERNHESEETGVLEPIIRDVPPPVLGREWPNYNDTSHGDGSGRRSQGSSSLPTDFFPFDAIPPLPGDPSFGRGESGQSAYARALRTRAFSEARSLVDTIRASSASRVSPANLDKVDEMKAAAAAAKMEVTPQEIEPEPVPMETDADRKRKEKEKRREVKVRRVQETMVSMRRKQGIFKPDDNYHAVPDWELMCLMASKPSNDWTYEHDEELVRYLHREIEKGSMIMMNTPLEKTITPDLFSDKEKLELYPKLAPFSPILLTFRSIMLKRIVSMMDSVLHLVAGTSSTTSVIPKDDAATCYSWFGETSFVSSHKAQLVQPTCSVSSNSSSDDLTQAFKSLFALPQVRLLLPLSQKRQSLVNALLRYSTDRTRILKARMPTINIDRRQALEAQDMANNLDVSVFMQVYSELKHGKVIKYRWPRLSRDQWWEVKFIGEGIIDQGGGFRDSMAHIADELCPPDPNAKNHLPFFIKTPNQKNEVGDHQDCYIPNPSCYAPDIYRWIGQLMGAAYRSSETFSLALPPYIWKLLLGVQVTWGQDYVSVDQDIVQSLDILEDMSDAVYVSDMQSTTTHAVMLSDESVVELKENGSQQSVLSHERQEYVQLARRIRMTECEEQVSWLREGLVSVVPEGLLSVITWQELEVNICGDPEVSLDDLKAQCHYSGELASGSEQVRQLWKALASFSSHDRSRFVRFVTGRKRLPAMLTISRSARLLAEDALPTASTCANTLYLPKFSSDDMAVRRLRYAIHNCVAIDTDTNPW